MLRDWPALRVPPRPPTQAGMRRAAARRQPPGSLQAYRPAASTALHWPSRASESGRRGHRARRARGPAVASKAHWRLEPPPINLCRQARNMSNYARNLTNYADKHGTCLIMPTSTELVSESVYFFIRRGLRCPAQRRPAPRRARGYAGSGAYNPSRRRCLPRPPCSRPGGPPQGWYCLQDPRLPGAPARARAFFWYLTE